VRNGFGKDSVRGRAFLHINRRPEGNIPGMEAKKIFSGCGNNPGRPVFMQG
jgi:hypothetical protein